MVNVTPLPSDAISLLTAGEGTFINAGTVGGTISSSGTLSCIAQGTVTVSGTATLLSPGGYSSLLVKLSDHLTTLDLEPGFVDQRIRLDIEQGATPVAVSLGSTIVLGTSLSHYTASMTAGAIDQLELICAPQTTYWRLSALSQGFTL